MNTKRVALVIVGVAVVVVALVTSLWLTPRGSSESARLEAEARRHLRDGNFEFAVERARALLAHSEAAPVDSARLAEALDLLVDAQWQYGKGREPEARALATRSLEIRERLYGPHGGPVVRSLLALVKTMDAEEKLAPLQRAQQIAASELDSLDLDAILVVRELGISHLQGRRYRAGLPYMNDALDRLRRSPEPAPLVEATILLALAFIDYELHLDFASARKRYERVIELRESELGRDHPLLAGPHNNLSLVLRSLGDLDAARRMLERAIELREKVDPELPLLASSLNNLGILLIQTGELDAAQARLERALAISVKAYGENYIGTAYALSNLGYTHHKKAQYEIAQQYYVRALAALAASPGLDPLTATNTMLDHAMLRYSLGDADSAMALCQRSVTICEETLGPDHPDVAVALVHKAQILAHRGEARAGLELALRVERIGREHMKIASQTLAEREALLYAGVRTQGLQLALHLVASAAVPASAHPIVWDALIRSRALVLDEMARRSRSVTEADDSEIRERARALDEARNRLAELFVRGAEGDLPRFQLEMRQARQTKERAERRFAEVSAAFRAQLARLELGLDDVQRALPDSSAVVAFAIYEMPADWDAPHHPADSGDAPRHFGFEFEDLTPHLIAFVMLPGQALRAVPLGRMAEIEPSVAAWAREASMGVMLKNRTEGQAIEAYRARATELRRRIWDPVAALVSDAQRVFVVPDGPLHRVNLAALCTDSGAYLIESGRRFHYLSSERDLVRSDTPETPGAGLLALGGPDYDSVTGETMLVELNPTMSGSESTVRRSALYRDSRPCVSFEQLQFRALPGTEAEVRAVTAIWRERSSPSEKTQETVEPTHTVLLGRDASEGRFKREAPGKRVIHLATHGFFLSGLCTAQDATARGLAASGAGASARWAAAPVTSPLLQAGLALAGANRRSEAGAGRPDGILTGEEIASLDLVGVQLAVLSACDTGLGDMLAGEGVLGLRRAFQVAGVRSLVMSLWSVSDEPTRVWMTEFYRATTRGSGTADATHHASLHILHQRRALGASTHAFYWASFVSVGDWRSAPPSGVRQSK